MKPSLLFLSLSLFTSPAAGFQFVITQGPTTTAPSPTATVVASGQEQSSFSFVITDSYQEDATGEDTDLDLITGIAEEATGGPTPSDPLPLHCTDARFCEGGVCYTYSDGSTLTETLAQYTSRTGKFMCSSGYCGTPAAAGTPAVGGCRCGCAAGACNCAHSPAVGTQAGISSTRSTTRTRRRLVVP